MQQNFGVVIAICLMLGTAIGVARGNPAFGAIAGSAVGGLIVYWQRRDQNQRPEA